MRTRSTPDETPADGDRIPPWVADLALAGAVALALFVLITLSAADGGRTAGPLPYVFAIGFGAALLLRRKMPRAMLTLSVLGTFAYYTLDLPTIGVALPVVAALYSAAERGLLRWSALAGAVMFVVALLFRLRDDPQPLGVLLGTDAAANIALIVGAIALGYGVRARHVQAEQQREIARLREEQLRRDAELRIRSQREHISRELHDTVGHSLSVISLHAGVAADALGHDDRAAIAAVAEVREQSTASLAELRAMVRILRSPEADDDARSVHSLDDVATVLDRARATGLEVAADIGVDTAELAAGVDAAAYRVLQESLTNVIRHAHAHRVEVSAAIEEGYLRLVVRDDGVGSGSPSGDGHGIDGMRERVRLLGGTLHAGDDPSGGFAVDAIIPVRPTP